MWTIESVFIPSLGDEFNERLLKKYLSEKYEPFAVTPFGGSDGSTIGHTVWLRLQSSVAQR